MKKPVLALVAALIFPLTSGNFSTYQAPKQAQHCPPQIKPIYGKLHHIKAVIQKEGGYQNHPYDQANRGAGTKYGITPATYKAFTGKQPTAAAMKALSKAEATAIYDKLWQQSNMDLLPDEVAGCVFDFYINTPKTAMQVIERITQTSGSAKALAINQSAAKAIAQNPNFCHALKDARAHYYQYRAAKYNQSDWHRYFKKIGKTGSPQNRQFLRGWLARIA